jgi:hypothetical protein
MPPIEFSAPWSPSLKVGTAFGAPFLVLLSFLLSLLNAPSGVHWLLIATPFVILAITALGMVLGYSLSETEIVIRRAGWKKRLPIDTLQAVEGKPDGMRGSLRLAGNGGLFSFTGLFWNKELKRFHAYATDPSRVVVLRYQKKTIVITPHDPQQFIARARMYIRTKDFSLGN